MDGDSIFSLKEDDSPITPSEEMILKAVFSKPNQENKCVWKKPGFIVLAIAICIVSFLNTNLFSKSKYISLIANSLILLIIYLLYVK